MPSNLMVHETAISEVYVFKTSVKIKDEIKILALLFREIVEVKQWNFDLQDCDNILRIEGRENIAYKGGSKNPLF